MTTLTEYNEISKALPPHLHYTWNNLNIMAMMDGENLPEVKHITFDGDLSNTMNLASNWLDNTNVNVKYVSVVVKNETWEIFIFYIQGA